MVHSAAIASNSHLALDLALETAFQSALGDDHVVAEPLSFRNDAAVWIDDARPANQFGAVVNARLLTPSVQAVTASP